MLGLALLFTTLASGAAPTLIQPEPTPSVMLLAEGETAPETAHKKPRQTKPKSPRPAIAPDVAPGPKGPIGPVASPLPPVEPAPPPPPPKLPESPAQSASPGREVSLRCETLAVLGPKASSRGVFTLSLIPSEANPDEFADVRVMSIDQKHRSIVRDTGCMAFRCSVTVTPGFYELSSQDRNKSQLKLSLNRQTGAFYGYEKQTGSLMAGAPGLKDIGTGSTEISETGWCVPETRGRVLF